MKLIYLDYAATTPLDERVLESMLPFLRENYGNPSSVHQLGRVARFAVEESRETVAMLLDAAPSEIIFTSGATEANNIVLNQLAQGERLITSVIEHESILEPARFLNMTSQNVDFISPNNTGKIDVAKIEKYRNERTKMVSLMMVNNEMGTINPIDVIARYCSKNKILFHTDAVQGIGKKSVSLEKSGVDFLSFSAHKFYGPKGVGALYCRGGIEVNPLIKGGSQERNRRAGTENVANIVGLTKALQIAIEEQEEVNKHLKTLQKSLITSLYQTLSGDFRLNTPFEEDACANHIVNLSFPPREGKPIDGEMLLLNLDMEGIILSSGSACTSGTVKPSHVLLGIGVPEEEAQASLRISLGKYTTQEEIDITVEKLAKIIKRMRIRTTSQYM